MIPELTESNRNWCRSWARSINSMLPELSQTITGVRVEHSQSIPCYQSQLSQTITGIRVEHGQSTPCYQHGWKTSKTKIKSGSWDRQVSKQEYLYNCNVQSTTEHQNTIWQCSHSNTVETPVTAEHFRTVRKYNSICNMTAKHNTHTKKNTNTISFRGCHLNTVEKLVFFVVVFLSHNSRFCSDKISTTLLD